MRTPTQPSTRRALAAWRLASVGLCLMPLTACRSDAEVVCEQLDECNMAVSALELLRTLGLAGIDAERTCIQRAEESLSEWELSRCAECVEDRSCSALGDGACDRACTPAG